MVRPPFAAEVGIGVAHPHVLRERARVPAKQWGRTGRHVVLVLLTPSLGPMTQPGRPSFSFEVDHLVDCECATCRSLSPVRPRRCRSFTLCTPRKSTVADKLLCNQAASAAIGHGFQCDAVRRHLPQHDGVSSKVSGAACRGIPLSLASPLNQPIAGTDGACEAAAPLRG